MVHISSSPVRPNIYQTVSAQWVIIPSRLDINKKMLLIAHGLHHTYMGLVALFADLVQIRINMVCCTNFTSWLQGTVVGLAESP